MNARDVQAHWFDVRKVMRTSDRFGRGTGRRSACGTGRAEQLLPAPERNFGHYSGLYRQ